MIPNFVLIKGAAWAVLPPGIYSASIDEVQLRFVYNERREKLFNGLMLALENLFDSGCRQIFLDGSYITEKPFPNDFEICWDPSNVNPEKLDPVFLDFENLRAAQKDKYGGEFFPSIMTEGFSGKPFLDFFQTEKDTGVKKGIISIVNDLKGGYNDNQ